MFSVDHLHIGQQSDIDKRVFAGRAWALLARYGGAPDDIFNELNGEGIHLLENMMVLARTVHNFFNNLELWLEEVNVSLVTFKPTFI
jgi:hypothetical protein